MKTLPFYILLATLTGLASACGEKSRQGAIAAADSSDATATVAQDNALFAPWRGPYQGVPAFDRMDIAALRPALTAAIAENLAEVQRIAANPEPADFANTLVALESAGGTLKRVLVYYYIWARNLSTPEFRALQEEMAPQLAALNSQIIQNQTLFERIRRVYEGAEYAGLKAQAQRLTELTYQKFARNGATLEGVERARYAAIEQRLAQLFTRFGNNVLADENSYVLYLEEAQLRGLSASYKSSAAAVAADRGRAGQYAVTNTRSSVTPVLTYAEDRGLREQVWQNYFSRGDNGDEFDNNTIITEILQLRQERVALLGFPNFAAWQTANRMAGSPEQAMELLEAVWPAAVGRVAQEVADMQMLANREGANLEIEPWDYLYYAEKVRQERYDFDADEVRQYLQMDQLREAMFYVADQLFNFTFTALEQGTVPVFHPEVRVWEVTDSRDGSHIGLWYFDPFAREGKSSGAWAGTYRAYSGFDGTSSILASNNSNFVKPAPGEPVLLAWDEARLLFHEFGHALHYLSSNVEYPSLNGGLRDYTEFQSQLLERWLMTDEVISQFLTHRETGVPMPRVLIEKLQSAATFNFGFATTEYLASALFDLVLHTVDPAGLDPAELERQTLDRLGMPAQLAMRHRAPHFLHLFSGENYAAGYYGYMWADVLTADAAEAFAEAPGGFYDRELAQRLIKNLFAPQNAIDPAEAYRAFRGRDAQVEALIRDRGF